MSNSQPRNNELAKYLLCAKSVQQARVETTHYPGPGNHNIDG
jgi:hypothetical protein